MKELSCQKFICKKLESGNHQKFCLSKISSYTVAKAIFPNAAINPPLAICTTGQQKDFILCYVDTGLEPVSLTHNFAKAVEMIHTLK